MTRNVIQFFSAYLLGVLALSEPSLHAQLNYITPNYPDESEANTQPIEWEPPVFYKIPSAIQSLTEQSQKLQEELAALAPFQPPTQLEAFGYHSDYLPALDVLPEEPRWVLNFEMFLDRGSVDMVLIPAQDQRTTTTTTGYAFPKRFRIVATKANGESVVFADWTKRDFPDPGQRPVYFHIPKYKKRNVTLEVFSGHQENGLEFFALARILIIRKNEVRLIKNVHASSSYDSKPYWGSEYLSDKRFTIGVPLGEQVNESNDLILPLEKEILDEPLIVEIDLGENHKIGWVSLFPAKSPDSVSVPGYGLPGTLKIEIIPEHDDQRAKRPVIIQKTRALDNPGNNLIRFPGYGREGRYLRIYFNKFPCYQGQAIFSLGEIQVQEAGKSFSLNQPVTITLGGMEVEADTAALVDGIAGGRPQIYLTDWLRELSAGSPLEESINQVLAQKSHLQQQWESALRRLYITTATLLGCIILIVPIALIRHRRKQSLRLRRQISSDLHDDVGSKVAAIGLASTYIKNNAEKLLVRQRGERIQTIAQTMHQALRDVLWVTDAKTDTLDQLVPKLVDTARQIVANERLEIIHSPLRQIPKRTISMQSKRDLLLFLKEALNNAITHSEATHIQVEIICYNKKVTLIVKDDGVGFEMPADGTTEVPSSHYGLQTLAERAKRLRGNFQIKSLKGQGTTVSLDLIL